MTRPPWRDGARRRDESGQVTTALVLVVFLALLSFALYGVFAISRAADDRTRAQSAADAAALAGAEVLHHSAADLLALLHDETGLGSLAGCGLGQAQAETYAERNGAHLTDYCFDLMSGRVRAVVRMDNDVTRDNGPAEAGAVVSLGFGFADCGFLDDPAPSPSPTPTPTPTQAPTGPGDPTPSPPPPPPPPPDRGTTLRCGPLHATFVISGLDGGLHLGEVGFDSWEPRLVD